MQIFKYESARCVKYQLFSFHIMDVIHYLVYNRKSCLIKTYTLSPVIVTRICEHLKSMGFMVEIMVSDDEKSTVRIRTQLSVSKMFEQYDDHEFNVRYCIVMRRIYNHIIESEFDGQCNYNLNGMDKNLITVIEAQLRCMILFVHLDDHSVIHLKWW